MVKKELLLKQFIDYNNFEEKIISKVSDFTSAIDIENTTFPAHQLFQETLEKLKKDSVKHSQIMKEITEYIKKSPKNEL